MSPVIIAPVTRRKVIGDSATSVFQKKANYIMVSTTRSFFQLYLFITQDIEGILPVETERAWLM